MQVLVFFCIVLCLVVDANTRSVTDTDDESSVEDLSQWQMRSSGNSNEDFCTPNPCKNGASCLKYDKKCSCKSGYSGVYCENCNCANGFCKEVNNGDSVCTCSPEWGLYSSKECKKCDCGKDTNCTFDPGLFSDGKKCLCRFGYEDKNGICVGTCKINPCLNGGECLVEGTDIECRCKMPFVGELCEKKENCKCENGFCKENDKGEHVCMCPLEWGLYSATKCKKCDCGKNYDCTFNPGVLGDGKSCLCRVGYEEINGICIDFCSPNPCKNGGICHVSNRKLWCECDDRFRGVICSQDICLPNPCRNGGICYVTKGKVACQCKGSFSGADCSIEIPFNQTSTSVSTPTATRNLTSFWTQLSTANVTNNSKPTSWTFSPTSTSTAPYPTSELTTSTDFCDPNPCKNYGKCFKNLKKCSCVPEYFGVYCEICKCENGYCKEVNNGDSVCTCRPEWGLIGNMECKQCDCGKDSNCTFDLHWYGGYAKKCLCRVGYEDRNGTCIEIPFSRASTSVSTTSATRNLTSFSTQIPTTNITNNSKPTSWTFLTTTTSTARYSTSGPTTSTGPCSESPCQNGGTCVVVNDSWKCLCKKPYLGILCETDPCDWNPCKNGGVCKTENETVSCYCKDPFAGEFCESRKSPCSESPCLNGGTCVMLSDSWKCLCKKPYLGILCETEMDTYFVTLVAVSVFLGVVLIFVTCVLCKRYHVKRTSSSGS